jgi:hypothetical protein
VEALVDTCVQCGKPLVNAVSGLACADCVAADVAASRSWAERLGGTAPSAVGAAVVARSCSFELSFNGISVDLVAVVAGPVALLLASVAVASAVRSPGPDRSLRLGVAAFAGLVGLWSLATAVG